MPRPKARPGIWYLCIVEGCLNVQAHKDEVRRHIRNSHRDFSLDDHWDADRVNVVFTDELDPLDLGDLDFPQISFTEVHVAMDTTGRGQRVKMPSEKLKETIPKKFDNNHTLEDPDRKYPPVYTADHIKVSAEVKEIERIPHHVKTTATGEQYEFFTLGSHIENKDKRVYIRAKQDPETMYFHAAEAPPYYARISDEAHPLCATDDVTNCFTADMLTKTGEGGQHTTRANVFAREGQWFWEGKVVSMTPMANTHSTGEPLMSVQEKDSTRCDRGTVRLGFCRREQSMAQPIGQQAYSYAAMRTSNNKFGAVNFRQQFFFIDGKQYDNPRAGDVIGLMITLPSLEIHNQVIKGTYNPAEHPELGYGPLPLKLAKKSKQATGKKSMAKPKSAVAKGKEKAGTDTPEPEHVRDFVRREINKDCGITTPATLDILRDRNPFAFKNNLVYFESPDYTPRPDLVHAATKNRTINPETGKYWEVVTDAHPCHEVPWLRTLPGSRIEIWVNGEYLGIAYEHLLAFLPPASYIEKSAKASQLYGDVDDGALGYYPCLTHYGGGTAEFKFNGPWWYGFDKEKYPNARPMGERYQEQIVEDFVSDMVDEICLEAKHGVGWMKEMVEKTRPPVGLPVFTGHGLQHIAPKP